MNSLTMPSGTAALYADLDVRVETDAPLAAHTWFGIGGRADCLVRPATEEALATLVRRCHVGGVPLRILGSGANLLVADEGVDGVVVKLDSPAFMELRFNARGAADTLRVGGGADLARVINECARRGLEGLSALAGIPASIGGAIRMNAGGRYGATGDSVHSVGFMTMDGSLHAYPASELRFQYRRTSLPPGVVLWSAFRLEETDPAQVRARVRDIFAYKKSTQPLAEHSAGCMFRNPVPPGAAAPVSAGMLIDRAGLKGLQVGGAAVSRHHGNFIVVQPGAMAADVMELVRRIQDAVREREGVDLEREVVFWKRGEA
ncbi:MAG: UDP-N-acetylmuramate dehydrogenase [Phycisphaerales bacterium]